MYIPVSFPVTVETNKTVVFPGECVCECVCVCVCVTSLYHSNQKWNEKTYTQKKHPFGHVLMQDKHDWSLDIMLALGVDWG